MNNMYKWQQEIIDRYSSISNNDLLESVIKLAGGDDWEGMFTDHGMWEFEYVKKMLFDRLSGWLKK